VGTRRRAKAWILPLLGAAAIAACGETRQPIGEECLRDEDCLSNVCSARSCVPAPQLTVPYGSVPDQQPRIPEPDGGAQALRDARSDG
jgi:hypothetical protein